MGFFDKWINKILGRDYDVKIRKLNDRILAYNRKKQEADSELAKLDKLEIKVPNFEIKALSPKSEDNITIKPFSPPARKRITTMKDLLEKRRKEEEERKRQLTVQITRNFDAVRSLIDAENAEDAEILLLNSFSALNELKNDGFNTLYNDLSTEINELKETLRLREIERQAELDRQQREAELRREEEKRLKEQREAEEREAKERLAREYEEKLKREEQQRYLEIERLTALVTRIKEDSTNILDHLHMKGIHRFYHFTDGQNLNLIRRLGGLYSWYYCEQNDIRIPNPGGDSFSRSLDRRHNLEDYVRLSFCDDHPMAYRKHKEGAELFLLYIDIEVASFQDTLFTDRNAASSSFSCGGSLEDLRKVDIRATKRNFVSREDSDFAPHQAEVLIKTFLPIKYISNINSPRKMIFY